jgi:hypothetical protein
LTTIKGITSIGAYAANAEIKETVHQLSEKIEMLLQV